MLSARTLRMLRYLADNGEVPLHVLIVAFWPQDEPDRAQANAKAWIREQMRVGHVARSVPRGLDTTLRLTPVAARTFQERVHPGAVGHPRARAHHAATLLFVEQVKAGLPPNECITSLILEPELRAQLQAGRGTRRGETFDSFPDAVVVLQRTMPDGTVCSRRVAVEYVTSKYTSKDILDKATSFAGSYDGVLWVADKPRTQQRVEALTGGGCACL